MQCDFLEWYGGILSGGYYCSKKDGYVDRKTRDNYCDNSLKYRDCPIYRQGNTGCYLTTCMCEILGYDDDCYVLNTLRDFRDNYMKQNEECLPLLDDYDTVGPIIADKLSNDEDKEFNAKIMLYFYIKPAIECIKKEEHDKAVGIYKDMTINLMHKYDIDTQLLSSEKKKSSARIRKMEPCFG